MMMYGVWLFLTLTIPITISVSAVAAVLGKGKWSGQRFGSIFKLDTEEGLISQGLLWLSIFVPITLAFALGSWVWWDYSLELSSEGFNTFIQISILPIAVMSISLPLAGLVSKFHATQQTAKQIKVVSFKNNLDAFVTHRKELISYFSELEDIDYFGILTFKHYIHPVLHRRFFTGSPQDGWPMVDEGSFRKVEGKILSASKFLNAVLHDEGGEVEVLNRYFDACGSIYQAAVWLHIKEVTNGLTASGVMARSISCKKDSYDLWTLGTTTLEVLAAIRFVKGFYDNLCDYSGVNRLKIPEGLESVFVGGQKIIDNELVIERLHERDLVEMVGNGTARYDVKHRLYLERTI